MQTSKHEFSVKKKEFKDLLESLHGLQSAKTFDQVVHDLFLKYQDRGYHNIFHVTSCLNELGQLESDINHFEIPQDFSQMKLALWYHDVESSEEDSIKYFYQDFPPVESKSNGFFPAEMSSEPLVVSLIRATTPSIEPSNFYERYIKDIDISILGKPFDIFKGYENNVRSEYPHVTDKEFCKKRAELLKKFIKKEKIYYTQYFQDKYEKQARANLQVSINKLQSGRALW